MHEDVETKYGPLIAKKINLIKEVANRRARFNDKFVFIFKPISQCPQSSLFSHLKIVPQLIEINSSGFFHKIVHGFPPPWPLQTYLHTLDDALHQSLQTQKHVPQIAQIIVHHNWHY